MKKLHVHLIGFAISLAGPASAATLQALSGFGGADGWLAPAEFTNVPGADLMRGMTYNPATNHLYVVDRTGGVNVRVLNGDTGTEVGTLNTTGVAGGTFALSQIDVDATGVIYAANLSTSAASNFKVYRWATEASAPTVAYDALTGRTRTGDSFAVTGSGLSTQFAAAGGSNADQHYSLFTTTTGTTFTSSNPTLTGAVTGGFRLGIDFGPGGAVLGAQTGSTNVYSASGVGVVTITSSAVAGEAPMAWFSDGSLSLFAMVDVPTSTVRLYDGNALGGAVLDSALLATHVTNGNGVGDLKFGKTASGDIRLYAMNTNNGIQAFTVIPEPAGAVLGVLGLSVLMRRRRH